MIAREDKLVMQYMHTSSRYGHRESVCSYKTVMSNLNELIKIIEIKIKNLS